ncbi:MULTISPECIES: YfjI family protein [Paenibacillus]|nr:YfjI family protein [Paenibacillus odorifer]OMC94465.1 hypothetical protein BJP49_15630 [Paenibacillus odorifer]
MNHNTSPANGYSAVDSALSLSKETKWAGSPVQFEFFEHVEFPVDALPETLARMTDQVSDVTQTSVDAAGAVILSMISVAAARKFIVRLVEGEGWVEKNNLYVLIAMPSGERKSAIYSHLSKPVIEFERMIENPLFRTEHGIRVQRYITDDVTPQALIQQLSENDERMALLSTEGGLFDNLNHKHYGNQAKLDVFLRAFTGDRMVIDRKNTSKIILNDPTLTMCIFVQPSVLQALPDRYTGQGFMGRFLYVLPPSKRGHRTTEIKSIPTDLFQSYRELIHHIMKFEPAAPVELALTLEALNKLQEFREWFEIKLRDGEELSHDFLRSWSERIPGQIVRIASLLHVSEQAMFGMPFDDSFERKISEETMNKAIALGNYFIAHAKAAFGCFKSNLEIEDAKYLLEVLKRKQIQKYKRQELWSTVKGKFGTAEKFDSALIILAERGFLRADITKSLRGRNGMSIECHPDLIDRVVEVIPPHTKPKTEQEG